MKLAQVAVLSVPTPTRLVGRLATRGRSVRACHGPFAASEARVHGPRTLALRAAFTEFGSRRRFHGPNLEQNRSGRCVGYPLDSIYARVFCMRICVRCQTASNSDITDSLAYNFPARVLRMH
eukprot:1195134-Prorocentrum_minimum.AAC.3